MTKTPIDAYWAGFLSADGCLTLYQNRWKLSLALSARDFDHVKLFAETYNKNASISRVKIKGVFYEVAKCQLTSRIEPHHLHDWGIVPRKTWDWREPQMPDELLSHFLRGWFDGDGHFTPQSCFIVNAQLDPLKWYADQLLKLGYNRPLRFGTKNSGRHYSLKVYSKEFMGVVGGFPRLNRKWNQPAKVNAGSNGQKTHCIHGHEFTEENTYRQKGRNSRSCLTCRRLYGRPNDEV